MKITEVNLGLDLAKLKGFKEIKMTKLGDTVILAGKNGSGKTRLLELIRQQAVNLPNLYKQKQNAPNNIAGHRNNINHYTSEIKKLESIMSGNLINIENNKINIENYKNNIISQENAMKQQQEILDSSIPLKTNEIRANMKIVDFVPSKIELEDWAHQSKNGWTNYANQSRNIGVNHLYQATIPLIQQVTEKWLNSTHPKLNFENQDIIKNNIDDYDRLKSIIKSFLGAEIGCNNEGYSTIFNKPIAQAGLSAGQRVLLQLCVAIFAQGGNLSDYIIFMDEPENHLHPSAVIELLDSIKKHNPDGQIWIATHSIPLLSHFNVSTIWFVEDGIVKHAGKKPESVLRSLLGNDEKIQKLRDFTSLPNELARNRFAFECLLPPTVVETSSQDPQSLQLNEQLKIIWKNRETLRLLDFGAGKGRMIANLSDYENVSSNTLDYHAYEPYSLDRDLCLSNIALTYDDFESRYHDSIDTIRNKLDDNFFDVVVLSNVLHEIPYSKWCETFSDIRKLLKKDGFLLLIEDCLIPTGELPHINGFVVFNTLQLKKLFLIPSDDSQFIAHDARFDSEEQRGRLMAHLIPSSYLEKISIETIKDAMLELKISSKRKIISIRGEETTYSNGLAHSFWVQQLANSVICLSEMGIE